jgi:uracil-DNA glycosylase family 4
MTSKNNLEKYVDLILDNWNWAKGFCGDCPFNVVNGYPGFAYGDRNVDVMVVGQNPGGNGTKLGRKRVVGSMHTDSSDYFRRGLQELIDYEDNGNRYDIVEILQAMTKETRFEDYDNLYVTNVCKCHSYDKWDNGLSKAINHCSFYLAGEIAFSRPKLVVTFGKPATSKVLKLVGINAEGKTMEDLHCKYRSSRRFPLGVLFFKHWSMKDGAYYRTKINKAFRKHWP